MEKITQEIVIAKNKERYERLKQLKENFEKPNITNNLVTKILKDLMEFPEITAKEINGLNISKILKKYWDSTDREVKNITNDLIIKWKKITKEAAKNKTPKITNEITNKPSDIITNSKEVKAVSSIKIESNKVNKIYFWSKILIFFNIQLLHKNGFSDSVLKIFTKQYLNSDIYDKKIEEIKNQINSNTDFTYIPNLRKTTKILLFENIAKIAKEKLLSESNNKMGVSNESNNLTSTNSINLDEFEKELIFIKEASGKIEATLNELFKEAKEKYIRKAKAIISNLRFNSELYLALFEERIGAEEIAKMDEKDMASKEIKLLRQKKEEESFNARRSDWDRLHNTFVSGMYRCGKCKQNKTTYYQAQIRRADEPMTTFVICLNCNNNWKC